MTAGTTAGTTAEIRGTAGTLSARDFIAKWAVGTPAHALGERAGAQAHFIDLCRVLGVPEPADPERYCFERALTRTGSGSERRNGFADVWLRGHFAWEYKAPGKSLDAALRQLMMYALPLESPPLLVVSDRQRIEVHTHFTGTPSERHVFMLEDIASAEVQQRLRALWTAPDRYKPQRSNRDITEEAARTFAGTADRLRAAGTPAVQVSHFLTQCLFCFFAEDVGLLPERLFERLVGINVTPDRLRSQLQALLGAMQAGGLFGVDDIPWFNGGLFKTIEVPALVAEDVAALKAASALNWSAIDPSIFGTLFERGLDPSKRSQLGAHYTDPATIHRLVAPVVQQPLLAAWQAPKAAIAAALAKSKKHGDKAWRDAQAAFAGYLETLRGYRVLDPACGSGNFLYLALKCLKDIEHQVNLEAEALGLQRQIDVTGPHNVLGIELNEYAAELARVTVWIGELQWRLQRGYGFKLNPVLEPLDHIACADALINPDGSEAVWPAADAVVGNPPFVGVSRKRRELGDAYVETLDRVFARRVPGGADLVCYWFDKAQRAIETGKLQRAGLVATNSIRGGASRTVLERICANGRVFDAWADEPWVNNGAAVRVSLICFDGDHTAPAGTLNGAPVAAIYADLTAPAFVGDRLNVSQAATLPENLGASFQGASKKAKFEIDADLARRWLRLPNPNGRPNSDVLKPWANGFELSRGPQHQWIIDFGTVMTEAEASFYEMPIVHVAMHVRPEREKNNRAAYRKYWWRFAEPRPGLRRAVVNLPRFIATVAHSKHRFFVWLPVTTSPDQALITVARADDTTLGLLHSRLHALWSLRLGTSIGVGNDPRYTPTTCFETFPFPPGLTPANTAHQRTEALDGGALIPADLPPDTRRPAEAIARAAQRLVALRDAWLNPPEWTDRLPEVTPLGLATSPYPDRLLAKPGHAAELAQRTLTKLYNARPAWLAQAHQTLDQAVAAAYGWTDYSPALPDDEILRRLLALNQQRAAAPVVPAVPPVPAVPAPGPAPFDPADAYTVRRPIKLLKTVRLKPPTTPPGIGLTFNTPNTPETSHTLNAPETPETPETPAAPDTPDAPETPDSRDTPDSPTAPDTPTAPGPAADADTDLLQDPRNVPVWFATNRAPAAPLRVDPDDPCSVFGNAEQPTLTLGRVVVNVPGGHKPGELGSGFWARLVFGDDRLRPVAVTTLPETAFWPQLGAAMAAEREPGEPRDALLFLHGYKNSFRDAALRTAQLAYDLRVRPAVMFSWPSGGGLADYAADENVLELSTDAITGFVQHLNACALGAGAALHIVGHSMGNRALLKALALIADVVAGAGAGAMPAGQRVAIDKIVFAAPDVDARIFTRTLDKIRHQTGPGGLGGRKTLYLSRKDKALWLSETAHQDPRAGLAPPVTLVEGVDTIDASDVDKTFLGHSYMAVVPALIADMKSLFEAGRAPGGRTGVEPVGEGAQRYWQLR